jgi:hypothetical protein
MCTTAKNLTSLLLVGAATRAETAVPSAGSPAWRREIAAAEAGLRGLASEFSETNRAMADESDTVYSLMQCVKAVVLRSGADLDSPQVGELRRGDKIKVLEAANVTHGGQEFVRVRCDRGWASLRSRQGNQMLEKSDDVITVPEYQLTPSGMAAEVNVGVRTRQLMVEEMQVVCPAGCSSGDLIVVNKPDGQQLQVQVPEGVSAGQPFVVKLAAGGTSQELVEQLTNQAVGSDELSASRTIRVCGKAASPKCLLTGLVVIVAVIVAVLVLVVFVGSRHETLASFHVVSGPCVISQGGRCVGRNYSDYMDDHGRSRWPSFGIDKIVDRCEIVVHGTGTLGPSRFDTVTYKSFLCSMHYVRGRRDAVGLGGSSCAPAGCGSHRFITYNTDPVDNTPGGPSCFVSFYDDVEYQQMEPGFSTGCYAGTSGPAAGTVLSDGETITWAAGVDDSRAQSYEYCESNWARHDQSHWRNCQSRNDTDGNCKYPNVNRASENNSASAHAGWEMCFA